MTTLAGTVIDGLVLKGLAADQAEAFFAHIEANRGQYADTIPFVSRTLDVETMRQNILRNLKRQDEGLADLYTLWDGDTMAGYFLVREKEPDARWAEIGYMVGKAWQGKGIAKRLCRLMLQDLFDTQRMQKVVICCNDDNEASIGMARSLGFREEGRIRNHYVVNGKLRTMLSFGLLKNEWEA